jgi:hypothetical protein
MPRLFTLASLALLTLTACGGHPAENYGGVNYSTPPADWARVNAGGPGTNGAPLNPSATGGGGTNP